MAEQKHTCKRREAFLKPASVVRVTEPPGNHFFGYYDKDQFGPCGKTLLGLRVEVYDRAPAPEDTATIGLIDLENGCQWAPIAETRAWNWQFGAMLQWLPGPGKRIIYNDRAGQKPVSTIMDLESGMEQRIPHPVFAVAADGRHAVSVNFARLWRNRPETGYVGLDDPHESEGAPERDGLFCIDTEAGTSNLLLSLRELASLNPLPHMAESEHYITHPQFNRDCSRLLFWHRWRREASGWHTRLYTADPDGSDLYLLNDGPTSHSAWLGNDRVLAWATHNGRGPHYFMFTDRASEVQPLAPQVLRHNGHFSFSRDRRWLLTDEPPDDRGERTLLLFDMEREERIELGRFYSQPGLTGPLRCDLHPRWDRQCTRICIDSAHEGTRQMYLLDLSGS